MCGSRSGIFVAHVKEAVDIGSCPFIRPADSTKTIFFKLLHYVSYFPLVLFLSKTILHELHPFL